MATGQSLDAARYYVHQGFAVVPIPAREKGPKTPGWQNLRLTDDVLPRVFSNGQNIGLLNGDPSGGLVDVDLDAPEAIVIADYLLPFTQMTHGRPSKPRSHRWYRVDPAVTTEQFHDLDDAMLVELRSTGTQTVVPPSIHPSGEILEWTACDSAELVDGRVLRNAVATVAAATLLARHWPGVGARHAAALALAGTLCRHAHWPDDDAETFIRAVCLAANDPETIDRLRTIFSTRRRLAARGKATGIPRLSEIIGREVVDRLIEWLGIELPTSTLETPVTPPAQWPAPLDPAAYHGIAGDVVRTIEEHTEADPAALLLNFLIAAGNAIGRGPHAVAEADRHGLNLFGVLVGESSKGRKGSSWGHIQRLFEQVDQRWATTRVVSGMSSGEGLIWAVRDPIEKTVERKEKGEPTGTYVKEVIDEGVTDKRLLVLEGEFAGVLKVMARDGSTLSPLIRVAWDHGNLRSLTKNSPAQATAAHISIIGHVTKDELLRYLADTETGNGFANRFLWFCTRRARILPEGGGTADLDGLVYRLVTTMQQARTVGLIQRDDEARQMWADIYEELSEGKPGLFGAVVARAEAIVLRLSALYAVLDGSALIRPSHLEAALAVWQYAEDSTRFVFGDALGDPTADRILAGLRQTADGLSRTDIQALFGRNKPAAEIGRALGVLLTSKRARRDIHDNGGRPTEVWYAV